jgi:hypothetical protein
MWGGTMQQIEQLHGLSIRVNLLYRWVIGKKSPNLNSLNDQSLPDKPKAMRICSDYF